MILSKKYLKRLIKDGKATREGTTVQENKVFVIVTRHDIRRTDHYYERDAADFEGLQ